MASRIHRFLQHLVTSREHSSWQETPALDGKLADRVHTNHSVRTEQTGKVFRGIRLGIRKVLKWSVRALYLSPLLILAKIILKFIDLPASEMMIVVFVLIVVSFFTLLNLYIFWSALIYLLSRKKPMIIAPFTEKGNDAERVFEEGPPAHLKTKFDPYSIRGYVTKIDELLPDSNLVCRDMWVFDGDEPWRVTEAVDFAVVGDAERPAIIRVESAPLLIDKPESIPTQRGLDRMSPEFKAIFNVRDLVEAKKGQLSSSCLKLSEGDQVEILGFVEGEIPNIRQFELGNRSCSIDLKSPEGFSPYRGASGTPGVIIKVTPQRPLWIRKI